MESMFNGSRIGSSQLSTTSFSGSTRGVCSGSNHGDEKAGRGGIGGGDKLLSGPTDGNIWLTPHEQPSGAYSRVGPVSLTLSSRMMRLSSSSPWYS
jgi:hypothetical protein